MRPPSLPVPAAPASHLGGGWIALDRVDAYLGVAPGVGRRLVEAGHLPLHRLPQGDLVVRRRDLDACCVSVAEAEVPACLAAIAQASPHPGPIGVMALLQGILERLEQALLTLPPATDDGPGRPPVPAAGLLTVDEAAGILRCSTRTVRRMIRAGTLPARSTGRAIRIQACDLQRVLRPTGQDHATIDAFIAKEMR